jgi:hypothetical protein
MVSVDCGSSSLSATRLGSGVYSNLSPIAQSLYLRVLAAQAIGVLTLLFALVMGEVAYAESKAIVLDPIVNTTDKRVALVIGNSSYGHRSANGIVVQNLNNPVNDARAIRDILTKLGFPGGLRREFDKKELERSMGLFAHLVDEADVAVTYFSGHGSTFNDVPYIVPTGCRIRIT